MPTVAITGGTGFIGRALASSFAGKRWSVLTLSRRQPPGTDESWMYFDLSAHGQLPDLCGVDVVIHAAYEKGAPGIDAVEVNRSGTARLVKASRGAGVSQFVFLSSFSAHDDARSAYGQQKRQIERDVLEAGGAVVRPGLVLGHGGLFATLVGQLKRAPFVPLFDGGRQPLQTIYIDDLCAALVSIAENHIGGTINTAEPCAVAYRDFFDELAQRIGMRCRFVQVNSWLALAGLRVAAALRMPLPITKDNVLGACDLRFRDTTADERRLGLTFRPFNESLIQLFNPTR